MHKRKIPKFKNDHNERLFWLKNDSVGYINWSQARQVSFPNLQSSTLDHSSFIDIDFETLLK